MYSKYSNDMTWKTYAVLDARSEETYGKLTQSSSFPTSTCPYLTRNWPNISSFRLVCTRRLEETSELWAKKLHQIILELAIVGSMLRSRSWGCNYIFLPFRDGEIAGDRLHREILFQTGSQTAIAGSEERPQFSQTLPNHICRHISREFAACVKPSHSQSVPATSAESEDCCTWNLDGIHTKS